MYQDVAEIVSIPYMGKVDGNVLGYNFSDYAVNRQFQFPIWVRQLVDPNGVCEKFLQFQFPIWVRQNEEHNHHRPVCGVSIPYMGKVDIPTVQVVKEMIKCFNSLYG